MTNKQIPVTVIIIVVVIAAVVIAGTWIWTTKPEPPATVEYARRHPPMEATKNFIKGNKPEHSINVNQQEESSRESKPDDQAKTDHNNGFRENLFMENQREIARMKKALPGNIWIPEDPRSGRNENRAKSLKKAILLSDKIAKGKATPEEKAEYYKLKIKAARDRIDIIEYIQERTQELSARNNKTYLTEDDIIAGKKAVADLEKKIENYRLKLEEALQNMKEE